MRKRFLHILVAIIFSISCCFCFTGCAILDYIKDLINKEEYIEPAGELTFHFPYLGNEYSGDCIYVKAGDNDILIDGGSRTSSINSIRSYIDQYVTDNILEYVIITHADRDHIACFAGYKSNDSIFDLYKCETIIDFPLTNSETATYARYIEERDNEVKNDDAVRYSALECYNQENGAQKIYNLTDDGNIRMEILYNYFYDHEDGDENNYSVCVMFYHGSRQFLFTGDLEKEGEEKLAENYDFSQVELFKAGHHGSPTSSNNCLLNEIKPKICVACCCAGSVEFTDNLENTFPSQAFIDRIAKYTDKVFTSSTINIVQNGILASGKPNYSNDGEPIMLNGDIQIISNSTQNVYMIGSNNNTILKETNWFKEYRIMPKEWE